MAPVIECFRNHKEIELRVCVTAQHREMLDQVLKIFEIKPDYDLNLMRPNQTLNGITSDIILKLPTVIEHFQPKYVVVHGDTTTTFAAALASFYAKVDVVHIEAGLRTQNILSPWPEELNRRLTSEIANIHFAPTEEARNNLLLENISPEKIIVTGNTVIDALLSVIKKIDNDQKLKNKLCDELKIDLQQKILLVTGHRRENFGTGILNICKALDELSVKFPDLNIIYPVHLNPKIKEPVNKLLANKKNIRLLEPLDYLPFVNLLSMAHIVLTDSGGLQEEAPALGKPVLVMRDTTERPEAITAGTAKLVGTDPHKIVSEVSLLLKNPSYYQSMSEKENPYGKGDASEKILQTLISLF